ncbi:BadF/BadG/BcrA/BcrD ATPase family protein [Pedobacter chitinilyticus]|jgi:N-acetylglucosamine kinase-like BadF-type ATPase|uniref:N-acetylglucosamine kinase n=1 Tax=Pedobacter chitinilyticus TaxID=2233776 RepID=A0A3S3SQ09_9SPHI|nr:BadF/BadG/BcrA/BcrD ATPase family protein [Pedobacter chitinilyticus]RWU05001.1 N-acetylglucosamine kinase [Pedobacter chitinilyticus]
MIVIADGGSTKTNWCLINEAGRKIHFNTEGYNPYFAKQDYIENSLRTTLPDSLDPSKLDEVYYYGAGCSTDANKKIVADAMQKVFVNAKINVDHDLLASCRALLGDEPGFAAILGTGTNTCLYDGKGIALNIDSLGYFLGDEGSGSNIGKRLLADYMKGFMPKGLSESFFNIYGLSNEDIFDNIYNKPLPNRFCASFSKFLYDFKTVYTDYAEDVIDTAFTAFFEKLVIHYPNYNKHLLNVVGSVGYSFRDRLSVVADKYEMGVGKIIRSPIDDLVEYHLSKR